MLEEKIDSTRPDPARVYDWFLGGKSYYPADEAAGQSVARLWPGVRLAARANRAFVHRAVRWLAAEAGLRQFIDIGTGIPTEPNVHQIAQRVDATARVVYADNRLIVKRQAEALMTSTPEGRTAYLHADFTDPATILADTELRTVLDLSRPVALCLNALLHYIADDPAAGIDTHALVATYVNALAPGSCLVVTHVTGDLDPPTWDRFRNGEGPSTGQLGQLRTRAEILRFFDGLELVDPGLVPPHEWRPDPDDPAPAEATRAAVSMWAGVGVIPGGA